MSKELEALEALEQLSKLVFVYGGVEQYKIIEKALKALEIIKEKSVDVGFLQYCSCVDTYNKYIVEHAWTKHTKKLTEEEFDLLKEVLL